MEERYDVIVIGAGPAGGSAAKNCAEKGLKTLLIEEHEIIGEPVHCGECLSQVCIDKLGTIDESAVALRVKGIRVLFPDGRENLVDEEGVVLYKAKFEQWIASLATKAGATLLLGNKVIGLERLSEGKNTLWSVTTKNKDGNKNFQADIVIDASGPQAVSNNLLKINKKFDVVIGLQYEMQGIKNDGYLDFYIWPKLAPHGYLWMIPKKGDEANVGLVTNTGGKVREYLEEFVDEKKWRNKKITKTFGGPIPSSGPVEYTYADGLMMVGDAAGFTSPLFEGGTHLGIQSGIFASQVAKKAIENDDNSASALSEYQKLWKEEFPNYEKLVSGKEALYSLSDEELKDLSEVMPDQLGHLSNKDKLGVLWKMLSRKRHLLRRKVFKVFNAFKYSRASKYGW
jgi:digeranylgeranylglycerophospholipid reductase